MIPGMKFRVILEMRLHGSACGSTDDVIDAETADEAEQTAIREWKKVRPDLTFAPLLTVAEQ
jgi:hypothetical protein